MSERKDLTSILVVPMHVVIPTHEPTIKAFTVQEKQEKQEKKNPIVVASSTVALSTTSSTTSTSLVADTTKSDTGTTITCTSTTKIDDKSNSEATKKEQERAQKEKEKKKSFCQTKIIHESTSDELESSINGFLEQGWILRGMPTCVRDANHYVKRYHYFEDAYYEEYFRMRGGRNQKFANYPYVWVQLMDDVS